MVDIRNGRRFSAGFALVVFGGVAALVARGAAATSLTVPPSLPVPVELTKTLSSQTAHVGDPFTFTTTKAVMLGSLAVPKGTPGHGRLAVVRVAVGKQPGQLGLQADSLDLPDGDTIWVNIDTSKPPKGHLADKHTKPMFIPTPIGFGGGYQTSATGNMILDAGTTFAVLTITPRAAPAPLLTATPTPEPTPSPTPIATPLPKGKHLATPLPATPLPATAAPVAPASGPVMTVPPAPPVPSPSRM
jgi:hypothetical protein